MNEERKGLPSTAYEEIPGEEYIPYVPTEKNIPEFSPIAIILGIILAIIFGMAMVYVGLKAGMTVSASVPAAVISMGILRGILRRGTILENNLVQTIASAGESLAAGVIFTVPAVYIWGYSLEDFNILKIFILSIIGGALGILMMIPLRHYLIVQEHGKLRYPEGTACAEVLVAGEVGGKQAKLVFLGIMVGAVYKFLNNALKLWNAVVEFHLLGIKNLVFSLEASPILLGVGYIIGPRVSALMLSGGLLAWFVFIPFITYCGSALSVPLLPSTDKLISQMTTHEIWSMYVRYIGAGAVAIGGLISLCKALPTIGASFKLAFIELFFRRKREELKEKRTFTDLSMKWVIVGVLFLILVIAFYPGIPIKWIGAIMVPLFAFFFVAVSSRIVGIVGSSSNPVSGMTIGTLIATCLIFLSLGLSGMEGMITALIVGAMVCIAMCMAGDISQDLKTGFLLGATPRRQQIGQFIGMFASSLFVGGTVIYLQKYVGIGSAQLPAPQATLMSIVIKGIMEGNLPWNLVITGGFLAIIVELLGVAALPFAVGLYLPLELSTPIMAGGMICWLTKKAFKSPLLKEKEERGILISSGLIAGDALMGIIVIGLTAKGLDWGIKWMGTDTSWITIIAFLGICCYLWYYIKGHTE